MLHRQTAGRDRHKGPADCYKEHADCCKGHATSAGSEPGNPDARHHQPAEDRHATKDTQHQQHLNKVAAAAQQKLTQKESKINKAIAEKNTQHQQHLDKVVAATQQNLTETESAMNNAIAIANRQKDDWEKKLREEVQVTKGALVTRTAELDALKAAQAATPALSQFGKEYGSIGSSFGQTGGPGPSADDAMTDDAHDADDTDG